MACRPPSTGNVTPVMLEATSEARNAIASATSLGCPGRPNACVLLARSRSCKFNFAVKLIILCTAPLKYNCSLHRLFTTYNANQHRSTHQYHRLQDSARISSLSTARRFLFSPQLRQKATINLIHCLLAYLYVCFTREASTLMQFGDDNSRAECSMEGRGMGECGEGVASLI